MIASKTRSEMVGLWSFLSQTPLIDELLPYKERRLFWQSIQDHIEKDYIDTRASLRGRYIDQEKFIRKVKNAAKAYELGVSLPWTDPKLADYCKNLNDNELFDKNKFLNKVILRKYLSKKLGIDYFAEPKYTFGYNFSKFVTDNIQFIEDLILSNKLFDKKLTSKVYNKAIREKNYGLIYQLFLLIGWHTFSRHIYR